MFLKLCLPRCLFGKETAAKEIVARLGRTCCRSLTISTRDKPLISDFRIDLGEKAMNLTFHHSFRVYLRIQAEKQRCELANKLAQNMGLSYGPDRSSETYGKMRTNRISRNLTTHYPIP